MQPVARRHFFRKFPSENELRLRPQPSIVIPGEDHPSHPRMGSPRGVGSRSDSVSNCLFLALAQSLSWAMLNTLRLLKRKGPFEVMCLHPHFVDEASKAGAEGPIVGVSCREDGFLSSLHVVASHRPRCEAV